MEFVRYDPSQSEPLAGGSNAYFVPLRYGEHTTAMIVDLGRRGDTGKREAPNDLLMTVVEGEGKVRSGGTIAELRSGDIILLPGGILHHIWTHDSTMRVVLLSVGLGNK